MGGSLTVAAALNPYGRLTGSSASSYLTDPTSPTPSHCAIMKVFQCINCRE